MGCRRERCKGREEDRAESVVEAARARGREAEARARVEGREAIKEVERAS